MTETSENDAGAKWINPKTLKEAKAFVNKRLEAFFTVSNGFPYDRALLEEWKSILRHNNPSYPSLLNFAVEKVKLKTIKRSPHHSALSNVNRAQYLEPWTVEMDQESSWEPDTESEITSSAKSTESNNSSYEKLLTFCIKEYDTPMDYKTWATTRNGKTVWQSTVKHDQSNQLVYGYGESENKPESVLLATTNALQKLDFFLNNKEKEFLKETESEKVENIALDSENVPYEKVTYEFIHSQVETVMQKTFQEMFQKTMDSMTETFDKRITHIMQNVMEEKINLILQREIGTQVDIKMNENITLTVEKAVNTKSEESIKNAVKETVKNTITDEMREAVVTSVSTTISNTAQRECKQIFERQFVMKINDHISDADKKITNVKNTALQELQQETDKATNLFSQLHVRDKAEINHNREQFKIQLKNQFEEHIIHLQNETNEHIDNIVEVATSMQNNTPPHQFQNSNNPLIFEQCEEVIYTDPITDQKCSAWISDIHDQDIYNLFYTVKFATKKELKVAAKHLSPLTSEFVQAHQIKPNKRFPNVDVSLLSAKPAQPQTTQPPVAPPHTIIPDEKYPAPNNFDVKAFQQQFQPKL